MVNTDDAYGKRLADGLAKNAVTYGLEAGAALTTKKFQLTFNGLVVHGADAEGQGAGSVTACGTHQRVQHSGGDWRGAGAGPFK